MGIPDIPRLYTALAEWLACVMYISLAPKRLTGWRLGLLCGGFLALEAWLLMATGDVPLYLWLICMLAAMGLMFLLLYIGCDVPLINVGFCCVRAFLLAEFAASLEWQLSCFLVSAAGEDPFRRHYCMELLVLATVYGVIYMSMWGLDRRYTSDSSQRVGRSELLVAALIGAGAFALSNLSFLYVNTPFSGQNSTDIVYIRTLVDLAGVAILYAYHVQRIEFYTRYELTATNTLLKNQYDQYCMSRESIELVNQKYHDLKHQIAALRKEPDPQRRSEWLDEMESDIRQYEAQNRTGNNVLDTVLTAKSLYCQKNGIHLTCVADGTQIGFLRVMDICAIFGNALDNAIESVLQLPDEEQRLIHVMVCVEKGFLLIRIENYFGGTLDFENGLPLTTKRDKAYHGFGVKSIRSTVERYGGTMTVNTENGWFNLKILIPLPENGEQQRKRHLAQRKAK